jgi:hypothetical protein
MIFTAISRVAITRTWALMSTFDLKALLNRA